jgi:hypothetical protein
MPYIEPSVIEQAKRVDLLTYLQQCEPSELVKISRTMYCTKDHDSLKITADGRWYWWSRGFGGANALSYLIKVKGMRFLKAVEHLSGYSAAPPIPLPRKSKAQQVKALALPLSNLNGNAKAIGYLQLRGIDAYVISECIKAGLIYESTNNNKANVVFVGKDAQGIARYGAIRGCGGDFKGEVSGSDKRFAFRLTSKTLSATVHVFESAIDALSYATLILENDGDWRYENLLSLGGVPPVKANTGYVSLPQVLVQYLSDNPHTRRVILHLDRDEPGIAASDAMATVLSKRFDVSISPPPTGKDVNDFLCAHRRAKTKDKGKEKTR